MKKFMINVLFLFPLACEGQNLFVFDREDGKPIEHAQMLLPDGKKLYVYKESNAAGRIASDRRKLKDCLKVSIRRLGYKSVEMAPEALPDTVWMEEDGSLSTVTVRGERQLYKMQPDRIVYDVSKDSTLQGKTAFEILQRLPMLVVANSGDVRTYDGKGVVYKINGLSNTMLSGNAVNGLQALPADIFDKAEIVTDYLTNTYTVNFSTKFRIEGYRASATASASESQWRGMLWGLTKIRKFTMSGSYANLYRSELSSDSWSEEFRYGSRDLYRYVSSAHNRGYRVDMNNIELAASYDISDRSILSFFVGTKLKANPRRGYSQQKTAYDPDGLVTLDMSCDNRTKMRDNETTVTVDYETVYGEEGQDGKFYAGYKFYTRPYRAFNTNYYDVVRLSEKLPFAPEDIYNYDSERKNTEFWHTLEAEYRRKRNRHRLEVLAKVRFRDEGERWDQKNSYLLCPEADETFIHEDMTFRQIYGMLTGFYAYELPKLKMRASVTPTYYVNYYNRKEIGNKFHKSFLNFQPSAGLTYVFSNRVSGEISYSMTQMNPGISSLNPYVNRNTPGQISYGNIHLKPETTHAFDTSVKLNVRKFFFTFSAAGFLSKDLIEDYFFLKDGLLHSTKGNIVNRYTGRVGAYVFSRLSNTTYITFNNSLDYSKYHSSVLNRSNYGFYYSCNGRIGQELTDNLDLELGGGYSSPYIFLQGRGENSSYWYNFSLSQRLLKSRLSISLNASNFIPVRFNSKSYAVADGYYRISTSRYVQASFGITIRYTFGKLKAEVKSTEGRIENDDVK